MEDLSLGSPSAQKASQSLPPEVLNRAASAFAMSGRAAFYTLLDASGISANEF